MRISHLNMYAGNKTPGKAVAALLKGSPASAGANEGYRYIDLLEKRRGYRTIYDKGAKDQRRGARDVPILTKNDRPSLGTMTLFGAKASTPVKIAPDRWMTVSMFLDPQCGPIAHGELHPHAGVQNPETGAFNDTDRATQFKKQMVLLDQMLTYLDKNFHLIFAGDLNFRDKGDATLSPYDIFRDHGMKMKVVGIDAIAWKGVTFTGSDIIPKSATGSDHEGLWADFK